MELLIANIIKLKHVPFLEKDNLPKTLVKINLKERHSTFIFTGHPLYGSFIIIMLAHRKCEHTYLCKLKTMHITTIYHLLVVTLKSMIPRIFINLKKIWIIQFYITIIYIRDVKKDRLWHFMYSYYFFHEAESRRMLFYTAFIL